jgi:hypothetical protein
MLTTSPGRSARQSSNRNARASNRVPAVWPGSEASIPREISPDAESTHQSPIRNFLSLGRSISSPIIPTTRNHAVTRHGQAVAHFEGNGLQRLRKSRSFERAWLQPRRKAKKISTALAAEGMLPGQGRVFQQPLQPIHKSTNVYGDSAHEGNLFNQTGPLPFFRTIQTVSDAPQDSPPHPWVS